MDSEKDQLIFFSCWCLTCKSLDAKCFTITAELQDILKEVFSVAVSSVYYP